MQSLLFRSQTTPNNANLSLQVAADEEPGHYTISGTADLPDGTELTVIGLRYLQVSQSPLKNAALQKPTYSILAYATAEVNRDRWQAQLNLWKVADDGTYQEVWQLHQPDLKLAIEPEDEVVFLATLAPIDYLEEIERQLASEDRQFASRFIQTTVEGNRYLQAGQVLAVDLPTGKTTPIATRPEDINGGWGNRFLELPDPPNPLKYEFPDHRQTTAPISREELLY